MSTDSSRQRPTVNSNKRVPLVRVGPNVYFNKPLKNCFVTMVLGGGGGSIRVITGPLPLNFSMIF